MTDPITSTTAAGAGPPTGWRPLCPFGDLADGTVRGVGEVAGQALALCRVGDDVFALDDRCTHAEAALSDGHLEGDQLECPLHFALFSVRTGQALSLPATEPVRTHPVFVHDGVVGVLDGTGHASQTSPADDAPQTCTPHPQEEP